MRTKDNTVPLRCAIYTRKSTEEGLEQAFNSLDAQREACEAYAVSQRHEGWQVLSTRYDDGGFSGGNLTRPALQRLLADINDGKVDLVVVYKIDRLTRSLMDFSKLVETFDRHQTSFVSVTQHFNTTSSMGRLTLNVLLSFAQFEREVTGERIRDKVAASKRKGMWMGGPVPLGYSLVDKALVVNKPEAALVRRIFERYCQLGCVQTLQEELEQANTRGRSRLQRDGSTETRAFSRGGLYAVLNRRLYLGEVHHKGESFDGQHEAIIPADLWARAQAKLQKNRHQRRTGQSARHPSLLAGLVTDGAGNRLIPTHTTKGEKRYRYYVTRPIGPDKKRACLPAHDVERIASEQWIRTLSTADLDAQLGITDAASGALAREKARHLAEEWHRLDLPDQRAVLIQSNMHVIVSDRAVEISYDSHSLCAYLLTSTDQSTPKKTRASQTRIKASVNARCKKMAGETRVLETVEPHQPEPILPAHRTLLQAIAQGREWANKLIAGQMDSEDDIARITRLSRAQIARGLKALTVPPTLVEKLVKGKAPTTMTWANLRAGRADLATDC